MKKSILIAIMLIGTFVQAQTTVHNTKVKIKDIPTATGLDTLVLVAGPDGTIKSLNLSEIASGTESDPLFAAWLAAPGDLNWINNDANLTGISWMQADWIGAVELLLGQGNINEDYVGLSWKHPFNDQYFGMGTADNGTDFWIQANTPNAGGWYLFDDIRTEKIVSAFAGMNGLELVSKDMLIDYVTNNGAGGGTDDQTATEVPFTPYSSIGSNDTQSAIQELKDEIDAGVGSPGETDPIYSAWNKSTGIVIVESQITNLSHTVDTDTQLNESQVDAFVANNGYITTTPVETDPVYSAWNKSSGITIAESQITDLSHTTDTDTQLSESQVDAFVGNNGYLTSETAESDPVFTASDASNTIGTNTGDQDLTSYETKSLRVELPAGAYTTNDTEVGKEITLTSGSVITLDDANVSVDYDVTFFNNTGGTITWSFGSGDAAIQGAPNDLDHGQYAYASLKAANTWSVMVGGSASSGSTTLSGLTDVTFSSPTLNEVIAYDGTKWVNQAVAGTTETDPVYSAWNKTTGISITESQISNLSHTTDTNLTESEVDAMVADNGYITSAGTDNQTAIEVPFTPSGNTTSTNVQSAIQEIQTELNGVGGAGVESDPVFVAWDKSSGISITESQISNLSHTTNTDDQNAGEVSFNSGAATYLGASNVQDGLIELYDETVRLDPNSAVVEFKAAASDDEFAMRFKDNLNQTRSYFEQSSFNAFSVFKFQFEDTAGSWTFYNGSTNPTLTTSTYNGEQLVRVPNNSAANLMTEASGSVSSLEFVIGSYTMQKVFSAMPYAREHSNFLTSGSWTPVKDINNEFIDVYNTGNVTITLDINGTVDHRIAHFLQEGNGTITFAAGSGVTLLSPNGLSTTGIGQVATVRFYHHNAAVLTITK